MRRLGVFNLVTLDGYIAGAGGDISWHAVDEEFHKFAEQVANSGNTLLFGRVTYELMAGYWPSAQALANDPVIAKGMNSASKIVFSRTMARADWSHTLLVKDDPVTWVRELKRQEGADLTLLGSGAIAAQLAGAGLIDEYQILFCPVALGQGKGMFEGMPRQLNLRLKATHTFGNGNVLLTYEPTD